MRMRMRSRNRKRRERYRRRRRKRKEKVIHACIMAVLNSKIKQNEEPNCKSLLYLNNTRRVHPFLSGLFHVYFVEQGNYNGPTP